MNTQNYAKPAPKKRKFPVIIAILGILSCILAMVALLGYFFLIPREAAPRPFVLIHSPGNGDQVAVGSAITIHATARDQTNITRMELWVDGDLVDVETSTLSGGISPFPLLSNWQAPTVGTHDLTVRAFNSQGTRSHGSITIEAFVLSDRDNDGVADEDDACPDNPSPMPDGCPMSDDRDNDGVADNDDACPDEEGWIDHDGCPTPGDTDGDGVTDEEDSCPEDPGLPESEGCPDRDGDSVPDDTDADPDEAGPVDDGGAPVPDDPAPDPGDPAPESGEPEVGELDIDGDGAPDDVDPCPEEFGEPEDGYCPPPEGDDPAEDDGPTLWFPDGGIFGDAVFPISVEIEAYQFDVSGDFDNVWCYVSLADEDMRRYEFEPAGERQWNIREVLGGANSVHSVAFVGEPLSVHVECNADNIFHDDDDDDDSIGEGGGWGTVYNLGTHVAEHNQSEWDGRELIATGIGPGEEMFQARYRICSPTCDETALPPPILISINMGPFGEGPFNISWRWDGDEELINGFTLTVNGTYVDTYRDIAPDIRSLDISEFRPGCGEVLEFQIHAYGTDPADLSYRGSPYSNIQVWDGRTCPRTVMVTFQSFDATGLGSLQGPIFGTFMANDQTLIADYRDGPPSFDGTDDTERYLGPGYIYSIATLFADIEGEAWACIGSICTSNYAPSTNTLEIEIGPDESLTFGAIIGKGGGGRAFEAFQTLPPSEILPGRYVVSDGGIELVVLIDVLVGPEAGGPDHFPDLTITDLTTHEESGQLRAQVFNNAADLVETDITINLVRISTNEQIDLVTWSNVTIPSGSSRALQFAYTLEPHDLRVIVNPDNAIEETNYGNNVYETPVRINFEFTRLRWGNTICESFLNQEGEFQFRMWVGHRSPDGDITWIAEKAHPAIGTIDADWSDSSDYFYDWDHPETWPSGWVLEGDSYFTIEFDMPADHTLVAKADGYEIDVGPDDYAGRVFVEYSPGSNYGSRSNPYRNASTGYHECHDGPPLGWDTNNFYIWWRINRIH